MERLISVAFISPGWPPGALANGIATYTGTMVGALREEGARCHVLTSRPMTELLDSFVHAVRPDNRSLWWRLRRRIDPEGWPQRAFCDALLKEIHQLKDRAGLDLVEMEESYGWAALLRDKSPVPLIIRLHGPWFLNGIANGVAKDKSFAKRDAAEQAGLSLASAVSAPSADVLRRTREHFGLLLSRAAVIPNPVEAAQESDRWNLDGCDPRRIVFIGRFDRHKGGDIALEAFTRVLRQLPDAHLDVVGQSGCVNDSGRRWSIDKYLAEQLPAATRAKVTYHGFLPGPQAARLRKQALVTIVPSRYESFSLAAAEAMMAGCPLVVAGAGALMELIQHDRNGLVARPGDADDLAEKVLSLLADPARAERLGRQAADDARERYSPHVVAKQTLEFYRSVM